MSAMSEWSTLRARVAGKWQVPLLLLSLLLLAGAFIRVQPHPAKQPFGEAVEALDRMVSQGFFDRAIEVAGVLLARADATDADRAAVELRLARARIGSGEVHGVSTVGLGRLVVNAYDAAAAGGHKLTAADYEHLGRAHEWQGRIPSALENYAKAIDRGVEHRSELHQRWIKLAKNQPDATPTQLNERLDRMLADLEPYRLDLHIWAIEEKIHVLDDLGRLDEVATLLVGERERFAASDFRHRFDYLEALFLYKSGLVDQAVKVLRTVRNRLERHDEVHAMTGWLLGRAMLYDDGPKNPAEALAFFTDVISYHPDSIYASASRVGMAEALAMLERHQEALEAYQLAIETLDHLVAQRLVSPEVLRTSLGVMAEAQRQDGRFDSAVEYARLATALVDPANTEQATFHLQQLAQAQWALAEERRGQAAEQEGQGRAGAGAVRRAAQDAYRGAAVSFLELARINILNEQVSAEWNWRGAEAFAEAGERDRAIELYFAFARERPGHSLVPRALLRMGELHQAMGRLPLAIESYQECYRRFPRLIDGARALVPLAECYLAQGPAGEELAEKTLRIVLQDSEVFTPDAPEFVDALFLLGDVQNRRGHFERAIATLEEALERYPDDERVWRARYLLADSYRCSALALKAETAEADSGSQRQQMQEDAQARFDLGRRHYRALLDEYEVRGPQNLGRLESMYYRHSFLYEADCFYETRRYGDALKRYEEAANIFRDLPSGMAAYVQMVNCFVFLGEPAEARAALARALIVVEAMPESAFQQSVSPETRQDWKRYFDWLGESELF